MSSGWRYLTTFHLSPMSKTFCVALSQLDVAHNNWSRMTSRLVHEKSSLHGSLSNSMFLKHFFQKHLNFRTWWPIGRCQPSNHEPKWSPKLVSTSTSLHQNFEGIAIKSCCLHPATAIMVPLDQGSRCNMDQVVGKENPWPLMMFQICDVFLLVSSAEIWNPEASFKSS